MIHARSKRDRSAFIFPASDPAIDFNRAKCAELRSILLRERESLPGRMLRLQQEIRRRESEHWLVHWIVEWTPYFSAARTFYEDSSSNKALTLACGTPPGSFDKLARQARAERQSAPVPPRAASAVPVPAPVSKMTSSIECVRTGALASNGRVSCCISTHATAPACSTTARINAATTVHLLDGLYTAADGTTRRRRDRFPAADRHIRTTRGFGATSELFNVVVCILVSDERVDTFRRM